MCEFNRFYIRNVWANDNFNLVFTKATTVKFYCKKKITFITFFVVFTIYN